MIGGNATALGILSVLEDYPIVCTLAKLTIGLAQRSGQNLSLSFLKIWEFVVYDGGDLDATCPDRHAEG